MQSPAPTGVAAGATTKQHFGNATAHNGSYLFQGNVYGSVQFPGKSRSLYATYLDVDYLTSRLPGHQSKDDDRCLSDLRGATNPRHDKKRIEEDKGGLLR